MRSLSWSLAILFLGCTSGTDSNSDENDNKIYWPEKDVASDGEALWEGMELNEELASGSGKWNNTVWLNFEGATVTKDQSFIVDDTGENSISVPAFASSDLGTSFAEADREQLAATILSLTGTIFEDLDVSIVADKPAEGIPYTTVHVGGHNFTGRTGVLGTAPLDAGNFSGVDIVFVYAQEFAKNDSVDNTQTIANVIAHEISHSLGARHIESDIALMNPGVSVKNADIEVEGNYPGESAGELTYDILAANVGLAEVAAKTVTTLPTLVNFGMKSSEDVAQISVISPENIANNEGLNLVHYDYAWDIQGTILNGPSIRVRFAEPGQQIDIKVTISHADVEGDVSFTYPVIRQKK